MPATCTMQLGSAGSSAKNGPALILAEKASLVQPSRGVLAHTIPYRAVPYHAIPDYTTPNTIRHTRY